MKAGERIRTADVQLGKLTPAIDIWPLPLFLVYYGRSYIASLLFFAPVCTTFG